MGNMIKISGNDIEKVLEGVSRQYLVGNLKLPQKLEFVRNSSLEIGITDYDEYTTEVVHYHTKAVEYQYMLSGWTKYMDVETKKEYEFKKGDFYCIESNTVYAQKSDKGTRILFIKVPSVNDKQVVKIDDFIKVWYDAGMKTNHKVFEQEKNMNITEDRMKHILVVARKMKDAVAKNPKEYGCTPEEAFTIGLLHDIGYEFVSEQKEHASKGGLILKEQNYKYWKEIYYHSTPQEEYNSPLLNLLNYVDMTTGPAGENMTLQQRIDDIIKRYGKGSIQEMDALKVINSIRLK